MRAIILALSLVAATVAASPLYAQQAESYRVNELEETVRRLNGQVEELQFQLLQMQEKLRRMEEENEARFQEIEEKQSALPGQSPDSDMAQTAETPRLEKPEPSGEEISSDGTTNTKNEPDETTRKLGTLTFDKDGNVVTQGDIGSIAQPEENPFNVPFSQGTEGAAEASEFGATPDEVFDIGFAAYNRRNYPRAIAALAAHLKAWPKDAKSGEVRYYLGQSLFWQKRYYDAAEMHLETHNDFPNARTAADNLLGLGLSLAGLNQREVACATYAEVLKQYPDATQRLGPQVKDEQTAARC